MAPDISQMSGGGYYAPPGAAPGYQIPDITFKDPANRRLKVLTIGAGVSGILMAYQIQKQCQNVEHVIYEKNGDIGGTWLENRYPGCACDVPSHAYTYNFALNLPVLNGHGIPVNPQISATHENFIMFLRQLNQRLRHFQETYIDPDFMNHRKYLDLVCNTFELRKYMTFNTEIVGCYWNEDAGFWTVKMKQTIPGTSQVKEIVETCDLLLYATGILNNFKWPDIEGLNSFKGKVVHTARWPDDYQKEEWKDESVAINGSGASSIQTLPTMQPHVKHIDTFVRTAVWFISLAGNNGTGVEYTEEQRSEFRNDMAKLVEHAKYLEDQINGLWDIFFTGSKAQEEAKTTFKEHMKEFIKDERLLRGFTPKFELGCRRVTPGDPYMKAIQAPNVDVHFSAVNKVTEDSVIDTDGAEYKVDTIICATGFDVSYKPRFPIVGQNGVELSEKWKLCPESYLGLAIPDMPNFITFIGPTWPVENGSVMGPLGAVAQYAITTIKKMQSEFIRSIVPKQDVTDAFNAHAQEFIKHTVWSSGCRSWYRNNETGRVNAVYPGSSLHYMQVIEQPRYEDYNITYQNKHNQWAYLGLGFTIENRTAGANQSPYLGEEHIDPKWLEVIKPEANCPLRSSM